MFLIRTDFLFFNIKAYEYNNPIIAAKKISICTIMGIVN